MEAIEALMTRKSDRKFTKQNIGDEDIKTILKAGMSGPSCTNARDWIFLVVKNRDTLNRMADANGKYAQPLRTANAGILVCGDLDRAYKSAKDYWIIDGAIAAQNMIIAAHALGIGSVWLGTYPQMDRVSKQAELFGLPETAIPHSIIAFGYPDESETAIYKRNKIDFEEDRVHYEKW